MVSWESGFFFFFFCVCKSELTKQDKVLEFGFYLLDFGLHLYRSESSKQKKEPRGRNKLSIHLYPVFSLYSFNLTSSIGFFSFFFFQFTKASRERRFIGLITIDNNFFKHGESVVGWECGNETHGPHVVFSVTSAQKPRRRSRRIESSTRTRIHGQHKHHNSNQ